MGFNTFKVNLLLLPFLFMVVFMHEGISQDSSVNYLNTDKTETPIAKYEDEIQQLKDRLTLTAQKVGEIKDCHRQRLIYTSTGCVNPISPEEDPSRAAHANVLKSLNTCAQGYAHQWNGSSWSCKEIRKNVNSGVVADTATWQVANAESCFDLHGRSCKTSDDTCPGSGNPIATTCTEGHPACYYTQNNSNVAVILHCR